MQLPAKQTQPAAQLVMHFPAEKQTRVTAHTLIYVSQCEMRHSNPVLQHGVFSAPFPVLSLFVRHSCFACLLLLSIALFDVELRFFVACFLDLFLSPFLCFTRLIHKLSLCFVVHVVFNFFFSNAVGDANSCQRNAGGSAVGHAISRRKINPGCSTGFECLISSWLTWSSVSTDGRVGGRSDGSDVITKPKFLALMGLPKSLSYGAPPRSLTAYTDSP